MLVVLLVFVAVGVRLCQTCLCVTFATFGALRYCGLIAYDSVRNLRNLRTGFFAVTIRSNHIDGFERLSISSLSGTADDGVGVCVEFNFRKTQSIP